MRAVVQVQIAKQLKKVLDLDDSQKIGFMAHVSLCFPMPIMLILSGTTDACNLSSLPEIFDSLLVMIVMLGNDSRRKMPRPADQRRRSISSEAAAASAKAWLQCVQARTSMEI